MSNIIEKKADHLFWRNKSDIVSIKNRGLLYEVNKNKVLFVMLIPSILFFIIFSYIPMVGIILAFERYSNLGGIFGSQWVGFENFKFLFVSGDLFKITRNTILFNIAFIFINAVLEIVIAILLSEMIGRYYKKACQSIMLLPYFISYVLIGAFVYNIFNFEYGTLNNTLKALNMDPVNIYDMTGWWKYILVAFNSWKGVGYGSIIYLATITTIDITFYEAAEIDGAGIFKRIWYITLPYLTQTVIILVLLDLGNILRGQFQLFYQVTGDNPTLRDATDIIDTYVFRALTGNFDIGMGSAVGLYQSVFGFITVVVVNYIVKKYRQDSALF